MIVKELIRVLRRDFEPTAVVLLSSDEEGNEILPFDGLPYKCAYDPKTGEIYDFDEEEGQAQRAPKSAIVLFPEHR